MNWKYTEKGEYPQPREGKDKNDEFQCLVYNRGQYQMLYWNCYYECWDDEQGDDYECDKDRVEKWCAIHDITNALDRAEYGEEGK